MNKVNYQKVLDHTITQLQKDKMVPTLLLHSCCAPCSSYVIEYLSQYFKITIFYYNPNIYPPEEYSERVEEQKRLINSMNTKYPVQFMEGIYDTDNFYHLVRGHEKDTEGGERCFICYRMRLLKTAEMAEKYGFEYFTTTLSISPLKNADKLNEIGNEIAKTFGLKYLVSDFKKKNGYKRSIELSKEFDLYRQNYCGCIYSLDTNHSL